MNVQEQLEKLDEHLAPLQKTEKDKHDLDVFRRYYEQFISIPSLIDWTKMRPFNAAQLMENYDDLPKLSDEEAQKVLSRVADWEQLWAAPVLNLLITVRDGKTFLDFSIEQNELLNKRYNSNVPLFLMDSFRTEQTTKEWLHKHGLQDKVHQFTQSRCPRIYEDTLLPVVGSPDEGFYPPGHGNVFAALNACGLLDKLIEEGRDIIFVSNIDNTAACVDVQIASVICREDVDYLMEITEKTQQDIKGGTLIHYENYIKHLELPHVPEDKVDEFCSLRTFKTFNTNNIWVDLRSVKSKLATMKLEKLKTGEPVIQLESAIGGAIKNFERVRVVCVHRSRFLPVKKAQDLLVVMGNAFVTDPTTGTLRLNPERSSPQAPIVHLSAKYEYVDEFLKHFPYIPDMLELETLTVKGDVFFGQNIKLKVRIHGNVTIEGDGQLPDGTTIEGQYTV
ncbi:UTP--glucose-1-phosphate uridylyltransferase [Aphelenchoides bicaudatus]|nr:UTP--glucose-1-phosphate uridylyltransferase [Aphelenchoides bicaudatus]